MRRAKLEGERRVLQRRHRAALEALGARAYELRATSDGLPPALGPSLADVEAVLMEIDALSVEIDAMREAEEA